jgi:hypothetical protein
MGIGVSIFLLAAGAILSFAVETDAAEGVNLDTVGIILMLIGGLGLLFSLLMFNDWAPWRDRREYVGRRDYADDEVVTPRRVVDVDEPVARQTFVEDEPVVRSRTATRRGPDYR